MRMERRWFNIVFLPLIGAIFLVAGVVIGMLGMQAGIIDATRAERLSLRGAAAINAGAIGEEVLFEGQISARNRAAFREFVAYQREEYRSRENDSGDNWVIDETVTPALIVESGRDVALISADYNILGPHSTWQEPGLLRAGRGNGTKRYEGFVVNRPITAIGSIETGAEGPQLKAEFIFGGTHEAYIANRRETASLLLIVAAILVLAGTAVIGMGYWPLIRRSLSGIERVKE